MNKKEREEAIRTGRMPIGFGEMLDFGLLCFTTGVIAFGWFLFEEKEWSPIALCLAVVFFAFGFWKYWETGKVELVAERDRTDRKRIEQELACEGYEIRARGSYFIKCHRKAKFTLNKIRVVLFWYDENLWGYAWMDGGKFTRMPFYSGASEIEKLREFLSKRIDSSV